MSQRGQDLVFVRVMIQASGTEGGGEKALQESSVIVLQSKSFISQVPNGHSDFCDYS